MTRRVTQGELDRADAALGLRSLWHFSTSVLGLDFVQHVHGDTIEALEKDDYDELFVLMSRGFFKSTLGCAYIAWRIAKNRNFRALILGGTFDNATKDVKLVRSMLEHPNVVRLYGEFKSDSWASDEFIVSGVTRLSKEPTVTSMSRISFKPGGHFDFILVDDLDDQDSVKSPEQMEKSREVDSLRYPTMDEDGAKSMWLATIWADGDASVHKIDTFGLWSTETNDLGVERKFLKTNTVRKITLDEEGDEPKQLDVRLIYVPVWDEDHNPTFPERMPRWKIERQRRSMTPYTFSCQYELSPIAQEDATFVHDDFVYNPNHEHSGSVEWFAGLDYASSLLTGSDNTGCVIIGIDSNYRWYVEDAEARKLDAQQAIENLFTLDDRHPGINLCIEEDNYVRGLKPQIEEEQRRRGRFLRIHYIVAGSRAKKGLRIQSLQGLFRSKSVVLHPRCRPLEDEALRFPRAKRDDRLDAMTNVLEIAQSAARKREPAYGSKNADPEKDPWAPWNRRKTHNQPYKGKDGRKVPWKAA